MTRICLEPVVFKVTGIEDDKITITSKTADIFYMIKDGKHLHKQTMNWNEVDPASDMPPEYVYESINECGEMLLRLEEENDRRNPDKKPSD